MHYCDQQQPNHSGFDVIGAGLPRTGTFSMRSALGKLLGGACYHMVSNVALGTRQDLDFWSKALEGPMGEQAWVDFLEKRGFRAGVDYPIALFYRDLMEAFPKAKMVLTVRDPEKWFESVESTILKAKHLLADPIRGVFLKFIGFYDNLSTVVAMSNVVRPGFDKGVFDVVESGRSNSVAFYNQWVSEVKQSVPEDRLLVFDVKQGWNPLCEFLGVPVPDELFPNVNDSGAILAAYRKIKVASYLVVFGLPLTMALLACSYVF